MKKPLPVPVQLSSTCAWVPLAVPGPNPDGHMDTQTGRHRQRQYLKAKNWPQVKLFPQKELEQEWKRRMKEKEGGKELYRNFGPGEVSTETLHIRHCFNHSTRFIFKMILVNWSQKNLVLQDNDTLWTTVLLLISLQVYSNKVICLWLHNG